MAGFLKQAQQILQNNGYKMTNARNDVLEVLEHYDQALTAYGIQDLLKDSNKEYQAITIYRVLDLLCELDLVHKIFSINAYIKCSAKNNHDHHHLFLVCEKCHKIKKLDNISPCPPNDKNFITKHDIHELLGTCVKCR
jgi:Fur family transcriptional regulator, zinc uptake regulator